MRINLGPVLDGTAVQPSPTVCVRDDGEALFYPEAVNGLHGGSGEGKGWLICHAIHQEAARGHASMLIDCEDIPASIVARLTAIGTTADQIRRYLIYLRPQTAPTRLVVDHLIRIIREHDVRLAVIDSVGEAFALEGIDENADKEVGPWYRRVPRRLAEAGPAVVLADHSTKAGDNPLHPSGSKRKRAAITGASYLLEAIVPFVKNQGGRVRLTCAKDRHGNYRRGQRVGDLVMAASPLDRIDLELYAPDLNADDTASTSALLAAKAATEAAKAESGAVTLAALLGLIRDTKRIKACDNVLRGGIDLAVSRGALTETAGARNARMFTFAHDLEMTPNP